MHDTYIVDRSCLASSDLLEINDSCCYKFSVQDALTIKYFTWILQHACSIKHLDLSKEYSDIRVRVRLEFISDMHACTYIFSNSCMSHELYMHQTHIYHMHEKI